MFKVDNADFIADKLAAELPPDQEYREVLKNALEAVRRRMRASGLTVGGRVVFDVDWHLLGKRLAPLGEGGPAGLVPQLRRQR